METTITKTDTGVDISAPAIWWSEQAEHDHHVDEAQFTIKNEELAQIVKAQDFLEQNPMSYVSMHIGAAKLLDDGEESEFKADVFLLKIDKNSVLLKIQGKWDSSSQIEFDYVNLSEYLPEIPKPKGDIHEALMEAYEDYIDVLGEELDELSVLAANRGWESTRIEEAEECRKAIEEAKKNIKAVNAPKRLPITAYQTYVMAQLGILYGCIDPTATYDEQWEEATQMYNEFCGGKYDLQEEPEYGCIEKFLINEKGGKPQAQASGKERPLIKIYMSGGLIQSLAADRPIDVLKVDYDLVRDNVDPKEALEEAECYREVSREDYIETRDRLIEANNKRVDEIVDIIKQQLK